MTPASDMLNLMTRLITDVTTASYIVLSVLLFVLTYYRLSKLDKSAFLSIRLAYYVFAVAIATGIFAVVIWDHDPSWFDCTLLASLVLLQAATLGAWTATPSYPAHYRSAPGHFDSQPHHN